MCSNYNATSHTCCNPFKKLNHNRNIHVLPITDFEREHFSIYLGNGTFLCISCRLQLTQTLHEHPMDDYLLLVDVLSEVVSIAEEQQRRNERQTRDLRELQYEFREVPETRPANNISTVQKSTPTGIDILLAAAEFVEENGTIHETENREPSS